MQNMFANDLSTIATLLLGLSAHVIVHTFFLYSVLYLSKHDKIIAHFMKLDIIFICMHVFLKSSDYMKEIQKIHKPSKRRV
jgi:hypothetical protein